MLDAELLAEAVTDASKGGEDAFNAWTSQQMEHLRALHQAGLRGHCAGGSAYTTGPSANGSRAAAGEPAAIGTTGVTTAASDLFVDAAASALGADHAEGRLVVTESAEGDDRDPLTLSQLAACHVGDTLRRAGMRMPHYGSAAPAD